MHRGRTDRRASAARLPLLLAAGGIGLAAALTLLPGMAASPGAGEAVPLPLVGAAHDPVILSGLTYMGNSSCAGSCHSEPKPDAKNIGNEILIFDRHDPHARAIKALSNALSGTMAKGLSIADATSSPRCLSCHGMNVPEAQRGQQFSLKDGVGCEACHGPAQKWREPHATEGWTPKQRTALGSAKLLAEFGLRDTRDIAMRTRNCVACHLQIDRDMIDNGHPPLQFEPWSYGTYYASRNGEEWKTHWEAESSPPPDLWLQMWAAGQFVTAEAASAQLRHWQEKGWDIGSAAALEKVYRSGAAIATKHLGVEGAEAAAKASFTPAAAAAAAVEYAALAAGAKSPEESRIVMYGVMALSSRAVSGNQAKLDELWDAHFVAEDALKAKDQPAFIAAVQKVAQIAKRAAGG